ncbi:glycosyltransferase family 4 protein [Cohnella sp. GbtcB17]|uniref:glycosyltransferase family 4 protein n=1 Tax=Cohnella sp. GbtcB17 TaxID=2824762 RepID=UPI001C307854|nr:glycosyltransferase family 4 protein [Cohnella sp. GbtcB17]
MRILQLIDKFPGLGGTERFVHDLSARLDREGHQVLIAAPLIEEAGLRWDDYIADARPLGDGEASWIGLAAEFQPDIVLWHGGNRTLQAAERLSADYPLATMFHAPLCPAGTRLFRDTDEICCKPFGAGCMVNWYARRCGSNVEPWIMLRKMGLSRRIARTARRSKVIYAVSDAMRAMLVYDGIPASAIRIVDNTLGSALLPMPPVHRVRERKTLQVLYVGRLVHYKGVQDLVKAVRELDVRGFDVHATIVGDGWYERELKQLTEKLAVNHRVRFAGRVAGSEVDGWYDRADVVVVPSIWPEPAGLVVPEARRRGKPVIVYDSGGLGEWRRYMDGIAVVPRGDVSRLADAIVRTGEGGAADAKAGIANRADIVDELKWLCGSG